MEIANLTLVETLLAIGAAYGLLCLTFRVVMAIAYKVLVVFFPKTLEKHLLAQKDKWEN